MSDSITAPSPDTLAAPAASTMLVIPPQSGRPVAAFGSVAVFKLEGSHTGGAFSLFLAETPSGAGPPLHVHHHEDELFLVQRGFEDFYTRAAQLFASGAANPERLQSLAREFGYQFLAPASPPPARGG